jgi:hypothetical protein
MPQSNLLLDEPTFCVQPTLAAKFGFEESILLQQIAYWMPRSHHTIHGVKWVKKTVKEWHEEMPFLSIKQVRKCLDKLVSSKVVVASRLSKDATDHTLYYTIDRYQFEEITGQQPQLPFAQTGKSNCPNGQNVLPKQADEVPERANRNAPQGKTIYNDVQRIPTENTRELDSIPPVASNQTCCPFMRKSHAFDGPLEQAKVLVHDVWREVFPHAVCYDLSSAHSLSALINKGMMPQAIADAFRYWLKHASDNEQMAGYPIGWFVTAVPAISTKVNQPAPESDFERSLRKQEEREAKQAWIDNRSNEIVAEKQIPYPDAREIAGGEWEVQYGIRAA